MRIGLILLNYNEIEAIPTLIDRLDTSLFFSVIAVDGGSTDGSRELLEKSGIKVVLQSSKGRGDAFRLAFEEGKANSVDALVFLSTDGNEDPKDLVKFISGLNQGYDLIIGTRMIDGSRNEEDDKFFRPRKVANKTLALLAHQLFGRSLKKITDPINGYRAITVKAWEKMDAKYSSYDIEFATSIRAYQLKLNVLEFPTIEMNRIGGESGARAIPTMFLMIRVIFRMYFK